LQRLVADEAGKAIADHRYGSAMRLALAAEPTADERQRGITPEPNRRAQLAAAAHVAPLVACLYSHPGRVLNALFSPHSSQVLTVSSDCKVRLWETAGGKELSQLSHGDAFHQPYDVVFSHDGVRVLTALTYASARLWEVASAKMVAELHHRNTINCVTFSP